jgi:hypothetical protein
LDLAGLWVAQLCCRGLIQERAGVNVLPLIVRHGLRRGRRTT